MSDIKSSWILDFILRQPIPNFLSHQIFLSLPLSSPSSVHPRLRKSLLLHNLSSQIRSSSPSERTLHLLELIEEHDRMRGAPPCHSLKAAYCAAAVDCTADARLRGGEDFGGVVERIWKGRVGDVVRSDAAVGLVSEELVEWGKVVEKCGLSGEGFEGVFDRGVGEGKRLVRDYLNEAMEEMGPSFLEIAAAAAEVEGIRMDSFGLDCEVGEGKEADQCVELGDSCMRRSDDDKVVDRSRILEDVRMKDLEGDGIGEKSTEGDGCFGAESFQIDPVVELGIWLLAIFYPFTMLC